MACFGGGGDVPAPPALSSQELDFMQKQGLTLDKFNTLLDQESINKQETQDVLKQLSGLYKTETVPGTPAGTKTVLVDTAPIEAQIAKIGTLQGVRPDILQAYRDAGVPDAVLNYLQKTEVPDSGIRLGKLAPAFAALKAQAAADPDFAAKMGLATTTATAATPDTTRTVLDPEAVASLRKRIQQETQAQTDMTNKANEFLQGFLNPPKTEYQQLQEEAGILSARRLVAALKGELPVSPAIAQQKTKDFQLLKEAAGRNGIDIKGDTPDEAVSQSTAGIQMLDEFKRRYDYAEALDRQGALDSSQHENLSRYGLVSDLGTTRFNQALQLRTPSGSTAIPLLSGALTAGAPNSAGVATAVGGYATAAQPYANYNNLLYQGQLAGYQADAQGQQAFGQLLGYGGSALLTRAILKS